MDVDSPDGEPELGEFVEERKRSEDWIGAEKAVEAKKSEEEICMDARMKEAVKVMEERCGRVMEPELALEAYQCLQKEEERQPLIDTYGWLDEWWINNRTALGIQRDAIKNRARKEAEIEMGEAARKTQRAPSSSMESEMDSSDSSGCESLFPLSEEDIGEEATKIRKKAKARRVKKAAAAAAKVPVSSSIVKVDRMAAFLAARAKERETEPEESRSDYTAYRARRYRDFWNGCFAGDHGSYETITSIPPMRFTDRCHSHAMPRETLQIFSVKVTGIKEGLHWPLDVYGIVTIRDFVDHNRNIIFERKRDNCQTIREEDPYLALTGPSRAVLLSVHAAYIEADLKLKGHTESEDKDFSLLVTAYTHRGGWVSFMSNRSVTSRLSTLEFTAGHIKHSVEATISVEVIGGEWPYGFRGVFTASTSSIGDMEVLLLAFGDGELPVEDDGKIKLSRCVVCVEIGQPEGKLKVSAQALHGSEVKDVLRDDQVFTPKEAGRSREMLKVGSCEMRVTVSWSLLSAFQFD